MCERVIATKFNRFDPCAYVWDNERHEIYLGEEQ